MNILLVDDESLQLTRLEKSVKAVLPDANYFCYSNPLKVLSEHKNTIFDIAFLDIEMPGMNGISLAKNLKGINPRINIIFVTAYDNYALDAYKMHASGYVSKPVNEKKVQEEINGLRFDVELKKTNAIQVKCFGNFEVFYNNEPLKFAYSKSKELFAYLIDREGAAISINELNAILWEEDHTSYLRNLISDIQKTLKAVDASDVFIKRHNECYIDPSKVDCDAYEYKKGNIDAIRMYRGEYMMQFSWAFFDGND